MKNLMLISFLILTEFTILYSQSKSIPMKAKHWDYNEENMRFDNHKGVLALHITGDGIASINDLSFQTGTIEFDYFATGRGFCGIYFRRQSGENRTPELESEFFYLRSFKIDNNMLPGSVQYAPITRGTNLWDLLHDYEANAFIKSNSWNRVRLDISKEQMKCYLNGKMVLWIPELMGPSESGKISLEGKGIYSNMSVSNISPKDVPEMKGADVIAHDVRYLKDWLISPSIELTKNTSLESQALPDSNTVWSPISAGRAGLINLTKEISSPFAEGTREMVWMTTTLESSLAQVKRLNLGFSDDICVTVNGRLLHVDKNTFGQLIAKQPNGRLHIDNTIIDLPLIEGENHLTICLANNFFGWGLVARLNNMNGIVNKLTHGTE